jgi:hypothetical protein
MNAADPPARRHPRLRARVNAIKRWWSMPAAAFPPVVPNSLTDYPFRRPTRPTRPTRPALSRRQRMSG